LRDDESRPLSGYPDPRSEDARTPPYSIRLKAWAADVAADLHERFGDDVNLTVGYLHFPDGKLRNRGGTEREKPVRDVPPLLDVNEVAVSLDGPLGIQSGRDLTSALHVLNLHDQELILRTNGRVTAVMVDPGTGEVVGGFAGAQTMPGVSFRVPPRETVSIPMLVGTASSVPALGYAVPPGRWALEVVVKVQDQGRFRTPLLPVTVVA
jgi:hypothetical protein